MLPGNPLLESFSVIAEGGLWPQKSASSIGYAGRTLPHLAQGSSKKRSEVWLSPEMGATRPLRA